MKDQTQSTIKLLEALTERAKELSCLYSIEELLKGTDLDIDQVCEGIIKVIPPGWQFPEICTAMISMNDKEYQPPDFLETPWMQSADIEVQDEVIGAVRVYYIREMPTADHGPFLKEEKKLIETIADRIGHFMLYQRMKGVFREWQTGNNGRLENRKADWEAVLDLLRQTDNALFLRLSNKMLNHLCWSGIQEAEKLKLSSTPRENGQGKIQGEDTDLHLPKRILAFSTELTETIFRIAADHLSDEEILSKIQTWIQEDKLGSLVQTVHRHLPLSEVTDALRRYSYTTSEDMDDRNPVSHGLKVSLIRRILSDQLDYINLAKNHVSIEDLFNLLQKVIFSADSHGKLGGKSAGLFLASQVVKENRDALSDFRFPRTWYISSDMMLQFMHYNHIDEIIEQKYKDINRVRLEYPHVVQTFANSVFPPDVVKGLSMALDEFGEHPLIVRSSSLLEDRMGAAFFGKYKSLFLANQGTKQERLAALEGAVAGVYASIFSPDAIEYRAERGLLDFSEEMGIMIQEVVGTPVGHYFLPAFSGVAQSNNEYRWSRQIRREDGVVRLVPGLGPRLCGLAGDDHPVWLAPGRPDLRANVTVEETIRYAPRKVEVINLQTRVVETIETDKLLEEFGAALPFFDQMFSVHEKGELRPATDHDVDLHRHECVVTFDGLISRSPFVLQIQTLVKTLEQEFGMPVEIEFASDGKRLHLLQCRPQTYFRDARPVPIPKDVPRDRMIFSANRYVSNGWVPNITHIVFIDPRRQEDLEDEACREAVVKSIGKLNRLLPKRQFILMGPGQWGSQGGGGAGLPVTYFDISNTAVLIELAHPGGGNAPELSFGTHFFQELVESNIRYLPLYPEEEGIVFNERFLRGAPNILADLLPEHAPLSDLVRLIDVPESKDGMVVQVLMNADLDEALGMVTERRADTGEPGGGQQIEEENLENYWRWRQGMAEQIAAELNPGRFGVVGLYLFGSTKNGTAGPGSDIDLLVHFRGTAEQEEDLLLWLEGWSLCLDEMNYIRTGYRSRGLLDVHIVTDDDIERKSSYASKINAVTDAARPMKLRESE